MSDFDLVVHGTLVTEEAVEPDSWVAVEGETIAACGRGAPPAARETVDAGHGWIIPGVIDGQVHAGSQAGQEGLGWASRAAAAGGVTVMVDMPYDDPEPVASRAHLDRKIAEAERDCHVDVALFGTVNRTHGMEVIDALIEGGVCAFKFSTFEASPNRFPRVEEDDLYEAFGRIAPSGIVCGVHNQMQDMTRRNIKRLEEAGDTATSAFYRAHPPLIENLADVLIYEIGAETGARAHVVHASTDRSFRIFKMYEAAGHKVSIETCVQYLMLNQEDDAERLGAKIKHYPPIRPKAEVEALWGHIARGDCTFVSSDHVSWGLERKGNPNIFRNSSGGPGLETLLPAFWTGVVAHDLPLSVVVTQLCGGPARHFLLDDRKGSLDVGKDADIVVVARDGTPFDPSRSLSAVTWSSFAGMAMDVRVVATWCRGELVYRDGAIRNEAGYGRFLRPRAA